MSEKKDIPDKELFPPGFEPGTFRVWGERDNHYTTETLTARGITSLELTPSLSPASKVLRVALAGNRTRVNCLEGSYAHHYTTNAQVLCTPREKLRKVLRKRLLKLECVYSLPKGTFPYFFQSVVGGSVWGPWQHPLFCRARNGWLLPVWQEVVL